MTQPSASTKFLIDGPNRAPVTLALAHSAGAFMDSDFMTAFAEALAHRGEGRWRVVRFEFPYMAARREDGRKRPPDRPPVLLASWRSVIAELGPEGLVIGGKSMGGRMASMIADEAGVDGVVCLGYPFHPPGKPETLRVDHLLNLTTPTLIVQGTRDPLGNEQEVAQYPLSAAIAVHWIADGDHNLAPRKSSGRSVACAWEEAVSAVAYFLENLHGEA